MEIAKAQKRYATLDAEKRRYIPHWKEIAELACPDRGVFDTNKPAPISIDYKRFIDTTIVNAVNLFVSGLQLGIASPNREWFRPINKGNKDNKVTEESDGSQAIIAGKGVGSQSGHTLTYDCGAEHQVIMCVYHAVPLVDWNLTGQNPQLTVTAITDFPQPAFDQLGMQAEGSR